MNRRLFEALVTERYSVEAEHPFSGDQTLAYLLSISFDLTGVKKRKK